MYVHKAHCRLTQSLSSLDQITSLNTCLDQSIFLTDLVGNVGGISKEVWLVLTFLAILYANSAISMSLAELFRSKLGFHRTVLSLRLGKETLKILKKQEVMGSLSAAMSEPAGTENFERGQ